MLSHLDCENQPGPHCRPFLRVSGFHGYCLTENFVTRTKNRREQMFKNSSIKNLMRKEKEWNY